MRRQHDLKQEELAALWRTDRNVVGAYEAGRRRLPTDKAIALAEKYRIDLNWLLLGKGIPPAGAASEELGNRVDALERRVQNLEGLPVIQEALIRIQVRLDELAKAGILDKSRTHPDR